jgi:hypothetical protein
LGGVISRIVRGFGRGGSGVNLMNESMIGMNMNL